MSDYLQVITTTASGDEARLIAEALVGERLAACVQVVGPVTSVYRWKGEVEKATEWLCLAKTERRLYPRVEAAIKKAHSYEMPEILAFDVAAGSEDYLAWLSGELSDGRGD